MTIEQPQKEDGYPKPEVEKEARRVVLWFKGGRYEVIFQPDGEAKLSNVWHSDSRLRELYPQEEEELVRQARELLQAA